MADILPRHTLRATALWAWLIELLAGLSLKAAAQKLSLPFTLETFYQMSQKLRRALDRLRSCLCLKLAPPESGHTDPLLQTADHLKSAFVQSGCPLAEFQLHFQRPFLG